MKNFTNKFKQITSRLSARWLIMALMLLLGTSSAWGAYYVAGTMNGWSTNNKEWELTNGSVTRWLNAGTYEWKITNGSWDQSWGKDGNNISTQVSCSGPVTFNFSGSGTPTASFNCPAQFNQSAITFYYDATYTPDVINSDKCYFMLGDDGGASRTTLSRVSGTQYLYKGSVSARNNNLGWYIFYESTGYTENIHKWCYSSHKSTCTYNSAAATNKVYKGKSTTESVLGENNTSVNRYAWENSQSTYTTYRVNIDIVTGGTLTVKDYDNTTISSGTSKSILTVLKFSASPSPGYALDKIDIKNSSGTVIKTITAADLENTTHTLTQAVTIVPTWELDCEKPAAPQLSVNKIINVCEGKDNTYGYIEIDNYDSYSNCKFYLGSESNEITNNISEGLIGVNVPSSYKVIVKNDCGSTNEAIIDFTATNNLTPTGSVSISDNSPICSGEKATLTANVTTSNTISSYTWTKNDGSAHGGTLSNNSKTLTTASLAANTSYKVSVTLTNSGCSKTFAATNNPYTVTVNSAPSKPTVTLSPDDGNIIAGKSKATLTVSSPGGGVTYTLYERTRGKIDEGRTSFEITEAGTYYVKGANDCGESSASDEKIVKVCAAAPTVTIEGVTAPVATCKTLKAYFKITNIGGEACSMLEQKSGIRFYVTEEDARNDKNKKVGMLVTGIPAVNTEYNLTANYDWILPGTTYYYRAFAENCYGSAMSETIGSITTPASDLVVGTISGTNNVCSGTSTTLTLNGMTNGTVTKWQKSTDNSSFTDIANTTTTLNTGNLSVNTYFRAVVSSSSCRETKNTASYLVSVTPLPTITASKTSCAPYEEIMLSSAAGPGTTWSADGGMLSATSGESVTFKAAPAGTPYTVTAYANGCTDTETITVECAEEACSSDNTKIEILCKYSGSTMNCHAWNEKGSDSQDVAMTTWRGENNSTKDSEGYFKWVFDSSDKLDISNNNVSVIFTTSDKQSGHMTGLKVGKRYYFTYDGNTTATQTKSESLITITNPTVTTVSAEQKDGEAAVVIKGFLQATGCANITKYGYQYRVSDSGDDYTDVQEDGSKNICGEWVVECGDLEYGVTYDFRAKATNEGGGKGYGDVIQVTIQGQSTPVVIKAVRNDRTVNESHWADFVALYVQEDGISTAGAGATKATKYTWEYSTDGIDWVTNFTGYVLGGASATVGVTNGSEKCNNIRPTKTGKYRVKVTYDNDAVQESNIITITSDSFKLKYPEYGQNAGSDFAFEAANRTIPVFVVKTTENFPDCPASGMPSQDVEGQKAKKSVDVKIFENGNVVYDRKARMNYRGSSSLNFRKKSYAFCTGKEKTKNSNGDVDTGKENLFGLSNGAKDKDWVLYAAMPDPSMMRNRLIFDTYAQMTGKWAVDSKFVELIIDDEYMGVYVLMDKITNNEKRVNITAADGFILKFDKTDVTDRFEDENSEKRNTFTTEETGKSGIGSYGATFDQRFEIEYPEMEDADSEEKWVEFVNDNVKGKIEAFEKALEAGNYTEVRKLIDYESWADWFIISEFAKNVDAYRASCFFVYNGDKIEARPLWDQELSFNNTATTVGNGKGCSSTSGLLIQNAGVYSDDFPAPFWFTGGDENITGGLLNDPCFVTMVKNRYKDHLNNALSNGQLTGKISDYQTELTTAAQNRETATWRPGNGDITACTGGGTGYTNITVSNSISTMTDWIANRPAELTTALDALTGSSVNISIEPSFVETYPWEPFTLTVDAPEGYEYEMAFTKEGADATGNMVIEKGGDIYTVKIKRPANTLDQVFETVPYLATATLQVDDDGCGGMTTPEANVNIRLNDREEDCE